MLAAPAPRPRNDARGKSAAALWRKGVHSQFVSSTATQALVHRKLQLGA